PHAGGFGRRGGGKEERRRLDGVLAVQRLVARRHGSLPSSMCWAGALLLSKIVFLYQRGRCKLKSGNPPGARGGRLGVAAAARHQAWRSLFPVGFDRQRP